MTLFYKDKTSDNEWHRCPDEVADFLKLPHTHEIPWRIIYLAINHKSPKVRKKNQNRLRKVWKKHFGGVKQK